GATASIQLLPRLTPELLVQENPQLEIRGYTRLKVPSFRQDLQNDGRPVSVLLQPEIRGTFLPNNFPGGAPGDFDQINYTLLTANGQALNEIEPEQLPAKKVDIDRAIVDELPQFYERLDKEIKAGDPKAINALLAELKTGSPEKKQMTELVNSLKAIDPDSDNLREVSDMLRKVGVPIALNTTR
ncbi:MAG: hypothetical protein ACPGVO_23175, partial [Spirulinaceae cyanobacterium]